MVGGSCNHRNDCLGMAILIGRRTLASNRFPEKWQKSSQSVYAFQRTGE